MIFILLCVIPECHPTGRAFVLPFLNLSIFQPKILQILQMLSVLHHEPPHIEEQLSTVESELHTTNIKKE